MAVVDDTNFGDFDTDYILLERFGYNTAVRRFPLLCILQSCSVCHALLIFGMMRPCHNMKNMSSSARMDPTAGTMAIRTYCLAA